MGHNVHHGHHFVLVLVIELSGERQPWPEQKACVDVSLRISSLAIFIRLWYRVQIHNKENCAKY